MTLPTSGPIIKSTCGSSYPLKPAGANDTTPCGATRFPAPHFPFSHPGPAVSPAGPCFHHRRSLAAVIAVFKASPSPLRIPIVGGSSGDKQFSTAPPGPAPLGAGCSHHPHYHGLATNSHQLPLSLAVASLAALPGPGEAKRTLPLPRMTKISYSNVAPSGL